MSEGRVEAIFISAARGDLPQAVESARGVAGKGLEANRYFDTGRPEHFRLVENASQCVLVHEGSGRRFVLVSATCAPP